MQTQKFAFVLQLNYFLSFQKHPPLTLEFYQYLDNLLVTIWGFMLMKTFVSTSCMFPARISCLNAGIFYSDVIQHVIMVGIFTNDPINTFFSFVIVVARSIYCTKKAKNLPFPFSLPIIIIFVFWFLFFVVFFFGRGGGRKSLLADFLSSFFLNTKNPVRKSFFDFFNI